jgi:hypothetical protein
MVLYGITQPSTARTESGARSNRLVLVAALISLLLTLAMTRVA